MIDELCPAGAVGAGVNRYSNRKPMAKSIIFDIDGTLLDSVDLHADAWCRAFKHFGCEAPLIEIRKRSAREVTN